MFGRHHVCSACTLALFGLSWSLFARAQQSLPDAPSRSQPAAEAPAPAIAAVKALLASSTLAVAEQQCRALLADNASSPDAAYLLAYTLYREAKARESLAVYTAAAKLRKPEAADLMAVAADYVMLGDYKNALHWYARVAEWTPNVALAWYDRARTEFKLEMYPDALADFEKTLALAPGDERARDNLGLTYEAMGEQDKAKACFEQAIAEETKTHSGYSLPFLNLGSLLLDAGDLQGALLPLRTAASMSPENPAARQRLGEAYWKLHEDAAAERELLAAVTQAPQVPALHFLLGRVYHKEGKQEAADREFRQARTLSEAATPPEVPDRAAPGVGSHAEVLGSLPLTSSGEVSAPR